MSNSNSLNGEYWRSRRSLPRGNTLIELTCALGIIAALAAAGTPKFAKAVAARRADAAARRLAADIEWLRATARLTSASQSMTFNATAGSYSLAGFTDPDVPGTAYNVSLASPTYKAAIASVNFAGVATLSFNGFGVPSSGGTIVVQSGNATRTITVDGATGTATWQ